MKGARLPRIPATWPRPVRLALRPIVEPLSAWQSVAGGWVATFFPSIGLAALVSYLLPALAQPQLDHVGAFAFVLVVIIGPALETLIMAAVLEILLRLRVPALAAIAVSSVGWGIAHSLQAPAWGLVIWWPFLIFSTLYVAWRQRHIAAALGVVFATHALQNSLPMLAILLGAKAV